MEIPKLIKKDTENLEDSKTCCKKYQPNIKCSIAHLKIMNKPHKLEKKLCGVFRTRIKKTYSEG